MDDRDAHLFVSKKDAASAFTGGKNGSTGLHIVHLEIQLPRLRFRMHKVEEGVLTWPEIKPFRKSQKFILARIDRTMLDLAAQLLKTYAGLKGPTLRDLDVFMRRYRPQECPTGLLFPCGWGQLRSHQRLQLHCHGPHCPHHYQ